MREKEKFITSLEQSVEYFNLVMGLHPEHNSLDATLAAMAGKRRKYPVFYLGYQIRPDDKTMGSDAFELPEIKMQDNPEANLAKEIIELLNPIKMLNPVTPGLNLGEGTGSLVPSFGIPLNPELNNAPSYTLTLDQIIEIDDPDPTSSGIMPEMRKKIEFIKNTLPSGKGIYIGLPDFQGPFNIAHQIAGEEILTGPYIAPEKFHKVMTKVTGFWINALQKLKEWIGPEWLYPVEKQTVRIAECSVNLVSRNIYEEFILPYDLKIADTFKIPLLIHTCSGSHVFHATLDNLPNILFTEAGFIKNAVRGWTLIDEALKAIGNRPIVLNIGQEIYNKDDVQSVIKKDLDLYEKNPHLLYSYTQMEWKAEDKPKICELHKKLDQYWMEKYNKE